MTALGAFPGRGVGQHIRQLSRPQPGHGSELRSDRPTRIGLRTARRTGRKPSTVSSCFAVIGQTGSPATSFPGEAPSARSTPRSSTNSESRRATRIGVAHFGIRAALSVEGRSATSMESIRELPADRLRQHRSDLERSFVAVAGGRNCARWIVGGGCLGLRDQRLNVPSNEIAQRPLRRAAG